VWGWAVSPHLTGGRDSSWQARHCPHELRNTAEEAVSRISGATVEQFHSAIMRPPAPPRREEALRPSDNAALFLDRDGSIEKRRP